MRLQRKQEDEERREGMEEKGRGKSKGREEEGNDKQRRKHESRMGNEWMNGWKDFKDNVDHKKNE